MTEFSESSNEILKRTIKRYTHNLGLAMQKTRFNPLRWIRKMPGSMYNQLNCIVYKSLYREDRVDEEAIVRAIVMSYVAYISGSNKINAGEEQLSELSEDFKVFIVLVYLEKTGFINITTPKEHSTFNYDFTVNLQAIQSFENEVNLPLKGNPFAIYQIHNEAENQDLIL